jgi:TetR/AcrR family transcriptional regulator
MSSSPFYKETFDKISPEKQDSIFTTAITVFAECGFDAANINDIAKLAGVSIGSMYSYFESKEDLFLALVEKGLELLDRAMNECCPDEGTIAEVLERIFRVAIRYTEKHPDMCRLYLLITTDNMKAQTERLSDRAEMSFREMYKAVLRRAVEKGEVRRDIDLDAAALFIDNAVIMLQFSLTSRYYQLRMEHYLGAKSGDDYERLVRSNVDFICRGLGVDF